MSAALLGTCWACCSPDRKTDPWICSGFCQMFKWKLRATPEPGLGGGPAWGPGQCRVTPRDRDPDSAAPANPQAAPPLLHPTAWGQRMGQVGDKAAGGALAEPPPEKGVAGRQAGGGERDPTAQPRFQTTCLHQLTTHKLRETAKKTPRSRPSESEEMKQSSAPSLRGQKETGSVRTSD